ncbi:MAG: SEC-C domain-containing protein [Ilumatobacter sp.]|nr:SEC-C domain-containing protein [Ilumatobacter sp.]
MELVERLASVIGDRAVPTGELVDELGVSLDDIRRVVQLDGRFSLVDDSYVYTPGLLAGTTWAVPIDPDGATGESSDGTRSDGTPHEIPGGYVRSEPHLGAFSWWLITDDVARVDADGNEIDRLRCVGIWLDGDTEVIHGDADWLDGIGEWASFTVTDGGIRVEPLEAPPAPDPAQVAAVQSGFETVARADETAGFGGSTLSVRFASLTHLIDAALAHDIGAFRDAPIAPVPDLLTAAGLEWEGTIVGPAGFDWDEFHAWQQRNRLRAYYQLDDDRLDALILMLGACELFGEEGDAAFGADERERGGAHLLFAGLLADAEMTRAFLLEAQERAIDFHTIAGFTEAITTGVDGTDVDRSGLVYLRSISLQVASEWTASVAAIDEAVDDDTTHSLLLVEAAYNAADRSQPGVARQLLARAGVVRGADETTLPDEALNLLDEIEPFSSRRPRSDVKRNDPCPCGSGRKYKVCHLGKETLTLDERAPWLFDKATRYVRTQAPDLLELIAGELAEFADHLYGTLVDLPFTTDLALHEHGEFGLFLEQRGMLLPDDERELAERWLNVPRSVYAVESIGRGSDGGELRLRDIGTDEIVVVTGVQLDDRVDRRDRFVGRPLPVGDRYRSMSGFFPIAAVDADDVLAAIASGDPETLHAILAAELSAG